MKKRNAGCTYSIQRAEGVMAADWLDSAREDIDDPRRHTLGGFRPGRGFGASEMDEDETLSIEFEKDDASPEENPFGDLSAAMPRR
ncbi:MAG: hypothetical protein ABJC07_12840 [Acidobacteriota bacterium]